MPERPGGNPGAASAHTPVAELAQRATEQITRLVRDELTMARTEMTAPASVSPRPANRRRPKPLS